MRTFDKYLFQALDNYPFNLVETIESLEYALSANDKNTMAICLMGRIYAEQLKDYETAKEYFAEAISIDIHSLEVYPHYIETLILNEDYEEAHRLIDFAMTIKGISKLDILMKKVWLLEIQKDFKKAKSVLKDIKMLLTNSHFDNYLEETKNRIEAKSKPKKKKLAK
jgi:tetratricopeptide (TPR) repeat protein